MCSNLPGGASGSVPGLGVLLILAVIAGLLAKRFLTKGAPPTPQMAIDEGKRIQQTVNEARAAEVQR